MMTQEINHAYEQAKAQLESITDVMTRLRDAVEENDTEKEEEIREEIQNDPLSVEVNYGWIGAGENIKDMRPVEFRILLCTGGPAVQIKGELDQYGQPERAWIEYQDWGTPWTEYHEHHDYDLLLAYCREFYYSE